MPGSRPAAQRYLPAPAPAIGELPRDISGFSEKAASPCSIWAKLSGFRIPKPMSQYVYTLRRVGKTVPPKRQILKNISLNFFPGAKIGVLGLNGSGKSTLLRIMAGEDKNFEGEVVPMPKMKIGFLPQEPQLDPEKTVREAVEEGLGEMFGAKQRLEEIYAAYAEPDADFDKLAAEQAKLEAIVNAAHSDSTDLQMDVAAEALRLPPWDQKIAPLSGGEKRRVARGGRWLSRPEGLLLGRPP